MEKEYIIKETEKAIMVKGKFENCVLEKIVTRTFWIPKKCLNEEGNIKSWFIKSKIDELFYGFSNYIIFNGLEKTI